jgi:hypothetical protein
MWAGLRALWQRLLLAVKGRRPLGTRPAGRLLGDEYRASLSIRQIYGRLLQMAARLGRPRSPERTPYEYLGELKELLPVCVDDLSAITEAYVCARYGAAAADIQTLDAVEQAWQRVRQEGMRRSAR